MLIVPAMGATDPIRWPCPSSGGQICG